MMLSKLFAPLVVVDVSGRSAPDRSRPILSRVLDATNHRGSSIKLVRRKKTLSRLNSERLTYSLPLILASQLKPIYFARVPCGSIETRSRPRLLTATRHGFTFYVADPVSSIREQAI